MTPKEIELGKAYACRVFTRPSDKYLFLGETLEDFQQEFLLAMLESPNDSLPRIAMKLKFSRKMADDKAAYAIGRMTMFSDLLPEWEDEDADYIDSLLPDCCIDYVEDSSRVLVYRLAKLITKPGKSRTRLLDYAFGTSLGSAGNRCVRGIMYHHRFAALEFFHENGALTDEKFREFWKVAETMTRLSQSSSAVANRKAYWKKKEQKLSK